MPQTGLGSDWQKLCKLAKRVYPPVCHICGLPIDVRLPKTHRMSWTLDHLRPRAIYGSKVPPIEETRPAHRSCNSSRGKKPVTSRTFVTREW